MKPIAPLAASVRMIATPFVANRDPASISPTVIGTKKKARCLINKGPAISNQDSLITPAVSSAHPIQCLPYPARVKAHADPCPTS